MGADEYFSIPIFFIIFRETTEAAIIVSVLLSFLSQVLVDDNVTRKRLARQVWAGTGLGLVISLAVGAGFIVVWNLYATNLWALSEGIWVGLFSFVAVIMITVIGLAMLRTSQMQEKWRLKLSKALDNENDGGVSNTSSKYGLFILPLITVLREGLEAVVFIGGVTFTEEPEAIPLAVLGGVFMGWLVGFALYKGGNKMKLHRFFVGSTCLLLLIAAGLVAKGIAAFENDRWNRLTGAQSDDAGYYDPRVNVWALKCCDPKQPDAAWWGVFNSLLGWSNIASYWTVGGYSLYWGLISAWLIRLEGSRKDQDDKTRRSRAKAKKNKAKTDRERAAEQRPLLDGTGHGSNFTNVSSSSTVDGSREQQENEISVA